ncbi:MAG: hypothetical protein IJU51_04015 [Clostridia bacterium]|nr:hypothetical protein [Clostridia bacterium]
MDEAKKSSLYIKNHSVFSDRIKAFLKKYHVIAIIFFVILLCKIIMESWICDDAYHAFIMVRNLADGNGFVYNIGERVNASTCPFYTLVVWLFYAVSGNMYMSGTISCILFSAAAVWIILFLICRGKPFLTAAVGMTMLFEKSFISFTTSGLENAMLFFLASLFCLMLLRNPEDKKLKFGKLVGMALTVGITAGTRMDAVLIYVPVCIAVYFFGAFTEVKWYKRWLAGFIGLSPFIAWLIFSLYYYGFFFPNTAYAKLNTGFPVSDYFVRGLRYVGYSFLFSPILLLTIVLFIVLAIVSKRKKHILIASGIAVYTIYIVRIGGDFMVGRHFTLCFFISVFCLADLAAHSHIYEKFVSKVESRISSGDGSKKNSYAKSLPVFICLTGLVLFGIAGTLYHYTLPNYNVTGIADEKEYYFSHNSLAAYIRYGESSVKNCFILPVEFDGNGGYLPFAPGIMLYYYAYGRNYFDEHGLGDALLARLPARYNPGWRIGHMRRTIPLGYNETVETGVNVIENEHLAEYYDKLKQVISGDLNAPGRMQLIIDFNLGKYDYLLEQYIEESKDLEVYYFSYEKAIGF